MMQIWTATSSAGASKQRPTQPTATTTPTADASGGQDYLLHLSSLLAISGGEFARARRPANRRAAASLRIRILASGKQAGSRARTHFGAPTGWPTVGVGVGGVSREPWIVVAMWESWPSSRRTSERTNAPALPALLMSSRADANVWRPRSGRVRRYFISIIN